jgi:hypothetical protein
MTRTEHKLVADWAMRVPLRIAAVGFVLMALVLTAFLVVQAFITGPLALVGLPIVLVVPWFAVWRMPMEIRRSSETVFVYAPTALLHGRPFREFSLQQPRDAELVDRIQRRAKGHTTVRRLDSHAWTDNLNAESATALLQTLTLLSDEP